MSDGERENDNKTVKRKKRKKIKRTTETEQAFQRIFDLNHIIWVPLGKSDCIVADTLVCLV